MDICERVAKLPGVSKACQYYAEQLANATRVAAAPHGSIVHKVGVRPLGYPDWLTYYDAYDEEARGTASSIEMGHVNVPRGRKWTPGIHVLREAVRRSAV